jgi:hypothetical protein
VCTQYAISAGVMLWTSTRVSDSVRSISMKERVRTMGNELVIIQIVCLLVGVLVGGWLQRIYHIL